MNCFFSLYYTKQLDFDLTPGQAFCHYFKVSDKDVYNIFNNITDLEALNKAVIEKVLLN